VAEKGALLVINQQADFDPVEMELAATWLQDQGIPICRPVTTRDPGEVATAVAESLGKIDRLILGGGDGTISHAAETVMKMVFRWAYCPWAPQTIWRGPWAFRVLSQGLSRLLPKAVFTG
jgi:hypothetical protein